MTALPAPISRFIDATNAADSAGFLDAFAEDASLDDWGRVARGKEAIAEWDRTDNIGRKSQFELVDIEQSASDTYLVRLRVSGEGFNGTSPFRFTLQGGKISQVAILPD